MLKSCKINWFAVSHLSLGSKECKNEIFALRKDVAAVCENFIFALRGCKNAKMKFLHSGKKVVLPSDSHHHTVQSAADAEKTDQIVFHKEFPFRGNSRGDGKRYGSDVSEIREGSEIFFDRNAD